MKKKIHNEEKLREEFLGIQDELEQWGKYVDSVLNEYVNNCFVSKEHLQMKACHRVKDVNSFCEKVSRFDFKTPILEITDKVGTRVVLLDRLDVEKVSAFIKACDKWVCDKQTRDTESLIMEAPDMFTYQSDHFIVSPKDDYKTSVDRSLLTCEIQVRTILQHSYAEISHDTVYKKSADSNHKAKRMLASSMAFIEAADEKFIQIYQELKEKSDFYESLLEQLTSLYKSIVAEYSEGTKGQEIAIRLLNIYSWENQRQIYEEINQFVEDPDNYLKNIIPDFSKKCYLFNYPAVLVAFYGIRMIQQTTYSKWPFTSETLDLIMKSMNISKDSFS